MIDDHTTPTPLSKVEPLKFGLLAWLKTLIFGPKLTELDELDPHLRADIGLPPKTTRPPPLMIGPLW